jgi:guanylate kinase
MSTDAYGIIIIAAPSGTGKSTLCHRLLQEEGSAIRLSISTTSRLPRGQEKHGTEYFFVSEEEFKQKISKNEFAEWALVHGNYYGTEKKTLEDFWANRAHVLLDIDVQGAETLRQAYPHRILTVFLLPPSLEELERRLRGRGTESEASIQKRLLNAKTELGRRHEFNSVIVNKELDQAYLELKTVITQFTKDLESGTWQKHP